MEMIKKWVQLSNKWFSTNKEDNLLMKFDHLGLIVLSVMLKELTISGSVKFKITDIAYSLKAANNSTMISNIKKSILKMNGEIFTIYSDVYCTIPVRNEEINNKTSYYIRNIISEGGYFPLHDWETNKIIDIEC